MRQKSIVYLTTVTGDSAWVLLELLHRCGIPCYTQTETGFREAEEGGDLYVLEVQLRQAQRCLDMAGFDDEAFEIEESEEEIAEPETGNGAWRVFLVLILLAVICLAAGIFLKLR